MALPSPITCGCKVACPCHIGKETSNETAGWDVYMAKEAFTFPLFCVACMAVNIYWDCTDGWSVGASVGTSFFGIVVLFYVGKYLHFGRNYLKINANGIEIKELGKTTD